jgi:hypothetical protein
MVFSFPQVLGRQRLSPQGGSNSKMAVIDTSGKDGKASCPPALTGASASFLPEVKCEDCSEEGREKPLESENEGAEVLLRPQ